MDHLEVTLSESSEDGPELTLKERVMGMFAGHHLGDALGAPHEFKCNREVVYTGKLEIHHRRLRDARYFAKGERELIQPIGTVTDDTQMTIALRNMLVVQGKYVRNEAILAYAGWTHSKPLDLGTNTRYIFANKTVKGYESRILKLEQELEAGTKTISLSNGGLMRCSPIALIGGLADNKLWLKACKADVRLTNPYKIAIQCNIVYLTLLRAILTGSSIDLILSLSKLLGAGSYKHEVKVAIKQGLHSEFRDVSGKDKGYCLHALYCSIQSLVMISNGSSYPDIMKWVITQGCNSCTGQGDTDTNAAISGALVGAYFGFDTLISNKSTRKNWKQLQKTAGKVKGSLCNYVPVDFER
jgi:ADP-ribosyl-[dinitrogen reductase] hydrolase